MFILSFGYFFWGTIWNLCSFNKIEPFKRFWLSVSTSIPSDFLKFC
jgi:hypothetical protein